MAAALSSNCSLSAGRTQLVHVKSTPSGAKVSLNGDSVGETPVHVRVQRRDADAVLHIEEVGFESVERRLDRRLGGWFWGDFATALVLGSIAGLGAALDDGGFGPASIGFSALWSTAVLAPPLALGTVYEFPSEVDVFLQRIDGTVDPTAAKFWIPVWQSIGMRSDSLRIREWLVNLNLTRSPEFTQQDVSPIHIGTQRNIGVTGPAPLIAPVPSDVGPPG